ncbi:MAG: metX [Flaviaesturariibacter sp.]|nr:metX [Flaviaesturariibacter sp.]
MQQVFHYNQSFTLESGGVLAEMQLTYHTWGALNAAGDNVVWICHALTANSNAAEWWPGMIGSGKVFDTDRYFVVCANILGSCYGSTGPLSINPETGKPWYRGFALVTIRDMAAAHDLLRQQLNIKSIALLAGGSMGGYQALEWAAIQPKRIRKLFLIATSARESAWGIAIHTAQRLAIEADQTWGEESATAGNKGLKAARAIGMLTYRSYEAYAQTQTDPATDKLDDFKATSYITYQGDKLIQRFNAYSYWTLTKSMDTHNLARGRIGLSEVLKGITANTLVIGIESDLLCPLQEQRFLAKHIPNVTLHTIQSLYGHDGFLVETEQVSVLLFTWLSKQTPKSTA